MAEDTGQLNFTFEDIIANDWQRVIPMFADAVKDISKGHSLLSSGSKQQRELLTELKNIYPGIVDGTIDGAQASLYAALASSDFGERYGLTSTQSIKLPSYDDFQDCVQFARDMYYKEGIIRTVIDLMVDFSSTSFENITDNTKTKKFFDTHCKHADMDKILRQVFWEYYLIEDVFMYRGDRQLITSGEDEGHIYYPYTVLNPEMIQVIGSLLFEGEVLAIQLTHELKQALEQYPTFKRYFMRNMPREFKKLFRNGAGSVMPLNPDRTSRISRRRQQYQRYSTPFILSAAAPLQIKRRLREMDLATAEGNINTLVVLKIGDKDYPATAAQLKALAALLKNKAKSYELIWNHTLQVEFHNPDFRSLYKEKYEELDDDIAKSLGMPLVLVTGQGSNFANSWVAILALIERLERGRWAIKRWLENEYRVIAEMHNLKDPPKVRFKRMNLRDEKVFRDVLLNLYDRGGLDLRSVLEDIGFEYEVVKQRKKEDLENQKYFFVPYVPFSAPSPPKSPSPPKAPTPKQGGSGRPTTEVSPSYTQRPLAKPTEPSGSKKEV